METGKQAATIPEDPVNDDDGGTTRKNNKSLAVETAEDDILEKAVDSCLSVFQQSLSPRKSSRHPDEQRTRYRKRLESFQASTYFAKPCRLSPIVVARFGWTNSDRDVVQCESCQAVVAVVFHQLSKTASDKMVSWYETQLSESHTVSCPFRRVAINYYKEKGKPATTFPSSILTSVFPSRELELLEQVRPATMVRELVHTFLQTGKLEPLQNIPSNIIHYPIEEEEGQTTPSLLTRMVDILYPPSSESEILLAAVDRAVLETAVLLVLFGWRQRGEGEVEKADDSLSLMCPLCLAALPLGSLPVASDTQLTVDTGVGVESPPASKRSRTGGSPRMPWNAHRYYCPYMCGLASPELSTPLWQTLADKFLPNNNELTLAHLPRQSLLDRESPPETKEEPSAWMQIHRMLTQGISTCRLLPTKRSRDASSM